MTMHGSGKHFVGAGATPSMGLSQFRGGAKKGKKAVHYQSEEEEEYEGGRVSTALIPFRTGTRAIVPARVPSGAVVPARTPSGALVPLGPSGRPMARPSMPQSYYANLLRPTAASSRAITGAVASRASLASRFRKGLTAQNIANAIAMGVPLGMLGAYLADQGAADEDAGYFEDYAGEDFGPSGGPSGGPMGPSDGPMGDGPTGAPMGPSGGVPSDMTSDELAWYLQTGNLPERYSIRKSRSKRGKGKLTIEHEGMGRKASAPKKADGRTARAAVVKKVMAERGVSLAQASKIVKEEGLY